MDLWEDAAMPQKTNWQPPSTRKSNDDLDNFYDDCASISDGNHSRLSRTQFSSKRRKRGFLKPVTAVLLAIFVLVRLLSGDTSNPQDTSSSTPNPPVQTTPINISSMETVPSPTVPTEAAPTPMSPSEYRYFGKMLTVEQKKIYNLIREGISHREDAIGPFNVQSEQEVSLIVQSLHFDWPEYFWFRGGYSGSYYDRGTHFEYTINPSYAFSKNEYIAYATYVDNQTQDIIQNLSDKSDYEKVKGVYEYLIDRTIYDLDYTGTTIYELFHDGRAVCEGYARASQYLLTKLGVETLYARGNAGEYTQPSSQWEGHAWNIVKIDGIYYQIDTTWGDPVNDDGIQRKTFHYLNLTDEEMLRRHDREEWNYYPPCTDIRHNYYYVEGRYLESFNKDIITTWFRESYSTGEALAFKCANEDIYRSAYNWLILEGGIGELFRGVLPDGCGYSYSYSYVDELYILCLEES